MERPGGPGGVGTGGQKLGNQMALSPQLTTLEMLAFHLSSCEFLLGGGKPSTAWNRSDLLGRVLTGLVSMKVP